MQTAKRLGLIVVGLFLVLALAGAFTTVWQDEQLIQRQIGEMANSLGIQPVPKGIAEMAEAVSARMEREKDVTTAFRLIESSPYVRLVDKNDKSRFYAVSFGSPRMSDFFGNGFTISISNGPRGVTTLWRLMPDRYKYL